MRYTHILRIPKRTVGYIMPAGRLHGMMVYVTSRTARSHVALLALCTINILCDAPPSPVSYTHLDVYKRQPIHTYK